MRINFGHTVHVQAGALAPFKQYLALAKAVDLLEPNDTLSLSKANRTQSPHGCFYYFAFNAQTAAEAAGVKHQLTKVLGKENEKFIQLSN